MQDVMIKKRNTSGLVASAKRKAADAEEPAEKAILIAITYPRLIANNIIYLGNNLLK
jgi:hypothetical protein